MAWSFLIDENLEPEVARILRKTGFDADHIQDDLGKGTEDFDILDHARSEGQIIVTNDIEDFKPILSSETAGGEHLVILHNGDVSAFEIAEALRNMANAYGSPADFGGEILDDWL